MQNYLNLATKQVKYENNQFQFLKSNYLNQSFITDTHRILDFIKLIFTNLDVSEYLV